jgi:hypothetical protein
MRNGFRLLFPLVLASIALAKAPAPAPPADAEIPALAAGLAQKLSGRTVFGTDGTEVKIPAILDATRLERCLRTIGEAEAWPAAWLIVQDMGKKDDLVLRVVRSADGSIAEPEPLFLAARRDWDDAALEAAVKEATGQKPAGRARNVVVQSFTQAVTTSYVYELPKTGKDAKGLLALLPEGSVLRESEAIDLADGKRHTIAVVLERPTFVPADCTTAEGKKAGHRDEGAIVLVLAGETALEDRLDVTDVVRAASGRARLPRFSCAPGDEAAGAIDKLVDAKFEGREPVRLLKLGKIAESELTGTSTVVGVKKVDGAFKLFARPLTQ